MGVRRPAGVLVLAVLFAVTAPGGAPAQPEGAETWANRFRDEAPAGWAKYQTGAQKIQGRIKTAVHGREPGKVVAEIESEFRQAPGCAVMVSNNKIPQRRDEASQWELSAANVRYRFNLKRADGKAPWVLVQYSTDLVTDPPPDRPNLSVTGWVTACVNSPVTLNYNLKDDWPAMLASPDFRLISVAPVDLDGAKVVKVEFALAWAASETNLIRVVGTGRAWFDPERLWVMRKSEYKLQRGPGGVIGDQVATYEYAEGGARFPLLKRQVATDLSADGQRLGEVVTDLDLRVGAVPTEEFTMAAFGLPEPMGMPAVETVKPRWHVWLASTGNLLSRGARGDHGPFADPLVENSDRRGAGAGDGGLPRGSGGGFCRRPQHLRRELRERVGHGEQLILGMRGQLLQCRRPGRPQLLRDLL